MEKSKWRICARPSRSTPRSVSSANLGTGAASAVRRPRNAWNPLPSEGLSRGRSHWGRSVKTGPTDPRQYGRGVSRSWGPQPPTEAADGAQGRPWHSASRDAGGDRSRKRRRRRAAAPGLMRPAPGSSWFSRALPWKPSSSVKHGFLARISAVPSAFSLSSFCVNLVQLSPVFSSLSSNRAIWPKKTGYTGQAPSRDLVNEPGLIIIFPKSLELLPYDYFDLDPIVLI